MTHLDGPTPHCLCVCLCVWTCGSVCLWNCPLVGLSSRHEHGQRGLNVCVSRLQKKKSHYSVELHRQCKGQFQTHVGLLYKRGNKGFISITRALIHKKSSVRNNNWSKINSDSSWNIAHTTICFNIYMQITSGKMFLQDNFMQFFNMQNNIFIIILAVALQ